jgi:hypothetical protein
MASLIALTYYISGELILLVFLTFKRYNGVYFYSILVSTCGVIIYSTGIILFNFQNPTTVTMATTVLNVGFSFATTAYPVVLWSRLHLIIGHRPRLLRVLLVIIIFTGVAVVADTVGINYGITYRHPESYHATGILTHVEALVLSSQQILLSSMYTYFAVTFFKSGSSHHTRNIIIRLVIVQFICFTLDCMTEWLVFTDRLRLFVAVEALSYMVKLRLEFIVLNSLRSIVQRGQAPSLDLGVLLSSTNPTTGTGGKTDAIERGRQMLSLARSERTDVPVLPTSMSQGKECALLSRSIVDAQIGEKPALNHDDSMCLEVSNASKGSRIVGESQLGDLEAQYLGR